jgi:hypothetical protein
MFPHQIQQRLAHILRRADLDEPVQRTNDKL